ncbi:hypothetical protein [Streptomyces sp. SM11]|uniref:hypothetical protein n=1 Tax=Streptomyces sp. SM11 TaxID=565557 RepID=UPI000CD4DC58|nr:hypothetical protein [Streptomyces sp. SM11]
MSDEHILLRNFLATMNRLQADFERRLDGLDRDASQETPPYGHTLEATDVRQPWRSRATHRTLGLEAIWTDARRSSDEHARGEEKPFSTALPHHPATLPDQPHR